MLASQIRLLVCDGQHPSHSRMRFVFTNIGYGCTAISCSYVKPSTSLLSEQEFELLHSAVQLLLAQLIVKCSHYYNYGNIYNIYYNWWLRKLSKVL